MTDDPTRRRFQERQRAGAVARDRDLESQPRRRRHAQEMPVVPEQTPQEHRAYVQQLDEDLKTDPHAEPYDHIAPIKSVMKRDLASHERRLSELEDGLRGLAGSVGHISGQVDILVGLTEKLVDGKTATDGARIAADKEMTLARWSGRDKLYAALIAAALTIGIPLINRLVNGQSQPVAAPTVVP